MGFFYLTVGHIRWQERKALTASLPENKTQFVPLLENVIGFAEDVSEPSAQRLAFTFLGRCVSIWGQANPELVNGEAPQSLPGFDTFIYERLVPLAFSVPSNPSFNIKDGQMLVVSPTRIFAEVIAHALFRSRTRSRISCKWSQRHAASSSITSLPPPSFLHKDARRTPPSTSRPNFAISKSSTSENTSLNSSAHRKPTPHDLSLFR